MIKQFPTISVLAAISLCSANEASAQYGISHGDRVYVAGAWGLGNGNHGNPNYGSYYGNGYHNYYGTNYGNYYGGVRSNGYVSAYRYDPYVYGNGRNFGYQSYPMTYRYSTPQYFSMSPRGHSPRRYR